jgi:hypothetical protein
MKSVEDKEIDRMRDEMYALIEEDYDKNYEQILVISKKLDKALNKALFRERLSGLVINGKYSIRKKA